MNFEILKRSYVKRNILIGVLVVALISSLILNFTQAKYRVTESMPLIQGTINYSPSDLNIVAMYLNQDGAIPAGQTDIAPKFGYTLNEEQSFCEVNDEKINNAAFTYEGGLLGFYNLNRKGTKCSIYFDLIPDSEKPIINNLVKKIVNTEVTISINATDNIGVLYYYYAIDNGEYIKIDKNTFTVKDLIDGENYTFHVYVQDSFGNISDIYSETILIADNTMENILAGYTKEIRDNFQAIYSETTTKKVFEAEDNDGTTYYFAGNPTDNWVQFAGFYWRIIRVNGDGTIRIIYSGDAESGPISNGEKTQIATSPFNTYTTQYPDNMLLGYMYTKNQVHGFQESSDIKRILDSWYQENILNNNFDLLIDENSGFCNDRVAYEYNYGSGDSVLGGGLGRQETQYAPEIRYYSTKVPTFKCVETSDLFTLNSSNKGNQALNYPIGLITLDEAWYAGGYYSSNNNYFLGTNVSYWTMSPGNFFEPGGPRVFYVSNNSSVSRTDITASFGVRPVINLKSSVRFSGTGTIQDPYVAIN